MGNPYIGEVRFFAGNFPPSDWAFCDGSLVSIEDNEALFNLIGTTYGGDGISTFALPNLISRIPVSQGNSGQGTFNMGQLAGQETVVLTAAQLPVHSHPVHATSDAASSTSPSGHTWANSDDASYSTSPADSPMDLAAVGPTGGGLGHDNRAPALGLNFIISLQGIYPSQNLTGRGAQG